MNPFIAQPKTILRAIEASNRVETLAGKIVVDSRSRGILEGVLATGKPNEEVLAFWRKNGSAA